MTEMDETEGGADEAHKEPADCEECGGACQIVGAGDDGNERMVVCPSCHGTGFAPPAGAPMPLIGSKG